jgi:hypothetical protein
VSAGGGVKILVGTSLGCLAQTGAKQTKQQPRMEAARKILPLDFIKHLTRLETALIRQ